MAGITDGIAEGFKGIFLAGVGAMAITGEKAKDLVDTLVAKGEITVEQGKQLNSELKERAGSAADNFRMDALEARMKGMTPEQRKEYAKRAAAIAERKEDADAEEKTVVEKASDAAEKVAEKAKEVAEEAKDNVEDIVKEAKAKVEKAKDEAEEDVKEAKAKVKAKKEEAKAKAKDDIEDVVDDEDDDFEEE